MQVLDATLWEPDPEEVGGDIELAGGGSLRYRAVEKLASDLARSFGRGRSKQPSITWVRMAARDIVEQNI